MQYKIIPPIKPNKKYSVIVKEKGKDWKYLLSFGALQKPDGSYYEHYKDRTPLKLYSDLDHLDKKRRENFWKRHKRTNDKNSARYWDARLW